MRSDINLALKDAIKRQDKKTTSTLRLMCAAIKDRDIAARANGQDCVSEPEILEILAKMIRQRRESVTTYQKGGRIDLAQSEQDEIDIISSFLPNQLDDKEVKEVVEVMINKVGAQGLRDIGRVMSALKEQYSGQMDFSKACHLAKETLAN